MKRYSHILGILFTLLLLTACEDKVSQLVESDGRGVLDITPPGSGPGTVPTPPPASTAIQASVEKVTGSASNGTYNAGQTLSLTVHFNNIVTVSGLPRLVLSLQSGGPAYANYASGSSSNVLVFDYNISQGDLVHVLSYSAATDLDLNGGSIKTASGDDANISLPLSGSGNSLGEMRQYAISLSDSLRKPNLSSQWKIFDADNWDADGNGNVSDDNAFSFTPSLNGLVMSGRGSDFWKNNKYYLATYLDNQTGDFDYSLKITQANATNNSSRKGLMVANNMESMASAGIFNCFVTGNGKLGIEYASAGNDFVNKQYLFSTGITLPVWIRLEKSGNDFNCYYKQNDGDAWIAHNKNPMNISSVDPIFDVGIFSSARSTSVQMQVRFEDFLDLNF